MLVEGVKNADGYVPVYLVDATDLKTPETSVAFGSVTAKFWAAGATSQSAYTVLTGDWKEAGNGNYSMNIGASEWTAEGWYAYEVAATGCKTFTGTVQVRDKSLAALEDDVDTLLARGPAELALQKSEGTAARRKVLFEAPTGNTFVVTVSKDGAGFAASSSTATEIATTGVYVLAATAADLGTEGVVCWKCTGTNVVYVAARVVNHDPYTHYDADDPAYNTLIGKAVEDAAAQTIKVYDDAGTGVLKTLTHTTVGGVTTRTVT